MLKKTILGVLLFLTITSSGAALLYPQKANAAASGSVVSDPIHTGFNAAGWAKEALIFVKDVAIGVMRKRLLDRMTDDIISWINGEGKPQWLDGKMDDFLVDVADEAGAVVLSELVGKDIMQGLCQSNWASRIKISLQKSALFAERLTCTPSLIGENFNNFMDDFNSGGWGAWLRVSEGQNNPYGLYLTVLNEKLTREAAAKSGAEKEVVAGGGFLSDKVCRSISYFETATGEKRTDTGTFKQKDIDAKNNDWDYYGVACDKGAWETRTPGRIAIEGLNKSVYGDVDWVKNNEELASYAVAITDALVNRLIKEGVRGAKDFASGSQPSAGSPTTLTPEEMGIDITPPTATASVLDPWRIKLTASEQARITYTLDGTDPSPFSGSMSMYTGPIEIITPTKPGSVAALKWRAMDESSNLGDVQTLQGLTSPFSVPDLTRPVSVLGAINQDDIVLLSNEPSTIYYTLDGTAPSTLSEKYIKSITVPPSLLGMGVTVRWFAVDTENNGESTVRYKKIKTPLPNAIIPYIVNLVTPTANIATDLATTSPFMLDPSSSADNDVSPQIAMYEWDFDNDGVYDWQSVDWDRDSVFDAGVCVNEDGCGSNIGNGFLSVTNSGDGVPGKILVEYDSGQRQITLQVTDNEGLSNKTSVTVSVE